MKSYTGWAKKWHHFVHLIISRNINRFSKLFHRRNQETVCNKTIIKPIYPTTPQVCRYTILWNVRWHTQAGNATDQLRDQCWSSLACGPQTVRT